MGIQGSSDPSVIAPVSAVMEPSDSPGRDINSESPVPPCNFSLSPHRKTRWRCTRQRARPVAGQERDQAECLSLRVKDVDFAYRQLLTRDARGGKDRVTVLPDAVVQPLQARPGGATGMRHATLTSWTQRRASPRDHAR